MADLTQRAATDVSPVCAVLTLGHSTRPIDEFFAMLVGHGVTVLVDVRTVPSSRHNPQSGDQALSERLAAEHMGYEQAAGLSGFRCTHPNSPNTGWRNLSFRGYADCMQTAEIAQELIDLIALAQDERVALMCAEAVPWHCHRSLIADALIAHGVWACEIVSPAKLHPHKLTPFARVFTEAPGSRIDYPLEQP